MIGLKSTITQEVLAYYFLHEHASLYVNEIARRLGLDSGNLARKLVELEKEGLLHSEFRGRQRYYGLNSSFPFLNEYKKIVLKTVGFERTLREALKKVDNLREAYLFGSYAQNKLDASSDVDLLAIGNHKPLELQKVIAALQKKVDREINVITLTPEDYQKRRTKDPLMKSILQKTRIALL